MANFPPLKRTMLFCLDRCIEQERLQPPFLDLGCGIGDVSLHLAKRGWRGTAVDASGQAIDRARRTLAPFPAVTVQQAELRNITGDYNTILLWDVLEHIEHDDEALRTIRNLLAPGGRLLLAVPSNPREWRWDDDFYGHFRRYTREDLSGKLSRAGLTPVLFWDFTFPAFWALRRMYTALKRPPADTRPTAIRTEESATVNAWDIPLISFLLRASTPLWHIIARLQFTLFRNAPGRGHEMFALAENPRSTAEGRPTMPPCSTANGSSS